jgi:N-acetylglutamate synthase-like GNAT family acetyltransferase
MDLKLRRGVPADAAECGRICFEAFKSIAERHDFPPDFPSPDVASGLMALLIAHPHFYSIVAELDGRIVGSNFLDERSKIGGVGPITVDPSAQTRGIGRRLMENLLGRSRERGLEGVRLVQAGYNNQSLCLYTKLGFRTREPLSLVTGSPPRVRLSGYKVRSASKEDIDACNRLCRTVHGHDRAGELEDAVREKTALIAERLGRVTGYATSIGFFSHAVSETNEDMMALIGAAQTIIGPGILVPTRNHALFTWCLQNELQLNQQMTLMSIGMYCEPAGVYMPSVIY